MTPSAVELYQEAFRARCTAGGRPGQELLSRPGIDARRPDAAEPFARAVVVSDAGHAALTEFLSGVGHGHVTVFGGARRSLELMHQTPGWQPDAATAMVRRSLAFPGVAALPGDLALCPVHRLEGDPPGVALRDAAAAAVDAVGDGAVTPQEVAAYLAGLPAAVRLFAAVDDRGTPRATSGFGLWGEFATVIFVNTVPGWRGGGLGATMTAAALDAARHAGATQASLDSSELGLSTYRRLGFETAGAVTRFRRGSAV